MMICANRRTTFRLHTTALVRREKVMIPITDERGIG